MVKIANNQWFFSFWGCGYLQRCQHSLGLSFEASEEEDRIASPYLFRYGSSGAKGFEGDRFFKQMLVADFLHMIVL